MKPKPLYLLSLASILAIQSCAGHRPAVPTPPAVPLEEFVSLISRLSEPEGSFDSDNFVSNEAAYLRIVPTLQAEQLHGGAYLGVGPDQNYSYVAALRPALAFIIDIRRQNLLQHLYFKALFTLSGSRTDFVRRLFARPLRSEFWHTPDPTISELLSAVDRTAPDDEYRDRVLGQALSLIASWKLPLNPEDFQTIRYVARAFSDGGPDLKFTTRFRRARSYHPTYRLLLQERDANGKQTGYLADEARYQIVRRLHLENRIVPIVGDLAGAWAMRAAAQELERRGLQVRCLYLSNVEFYLFRQGHWADYTENLRCLPLAPNALIIRSYANTWRAHPAAQPGYYMSTLIQPARTFLDNQLSGRHGTYWDVVTRDNIAP